MKMRITVMTVLLAGSAFLPVAGEIPAPVTKNASKEATALLRFFYDISGKYTLTGQHNYPATKSRNSEFYHRYLGRTPVIFSTDMGFAEAGDKDSYLARPDIVQEAVSLHRAGALVAICWHAAPPTADEPVTFRPDRGEEPTDSLNTVQGRLTDEQFRDLLTPGTDMYNHWCAQVDVIAGFLKQLDDAHVPVLWRPYHEMNGNWFWWGDRRGVYSTRALYIQLFNRLVNHHELKNLIWVWSVDRPGKPEMQFSLYYPGDSYVDILSLDVYGRDFKQAYYDSLNALSNGRPLVLGEVGNPPGADILETQPRWSYWVIWAGMVRNTSKKEHLALLEDPRVLVLEKQSYWDAVAPYHRACGLAVTSGRYIRPRIFKRTDFSGRWILNEEKSIFGNFGAGDVPVRLQVEQNEDSLLVEKTILVEYDDDRVTEETIRLDGTETRSDGGFMHTTRVSTARWSAWGDTLHIESLILFGSGENAMRVTTTESWALENGGSMLNLKQSGNSRWGRQHASIVYERE
ncbi:hypothetical protein JW948_00635 [bacterium]|nr:hypothetical protein [bacterium]